MNQQSISAFIWSVADLLRGDYKPADSGKVILPFTVLRRLDCVLEPTKAVVLAELELRSAAGVNPDPFVRRKAKQAHQTMSKQALDSAKVRAGLKSILLGPAQLYEALRGRPEEADPVL